MVPMARGGLAPDTIKGHRRSLRWIHDCMPIGQRTCSPSTAGAREQRATTQKLDVVDHGHKNGHDSRSVLVASPARSRELRRHEMGTTHTPQRTGMDHGTSSSDEKGQRTAWAATKGSNGTACQTAALITTHPGRDESSRAPRLADSKQSGRCPQIRLCDVKIGSTSSANQQPPSVQHPANIRITFARGKTVQKRGSFTVSSEIPASLVQSEAAVYLCNLKGQQASLLLPNIKGKEVKDALRSATGDKALEQRSLRRGALQELAAQGMPLATLMLFSGHASERMLLRYLGHGRLAVAQNEAMLVASRMAFG